MSFDTPITPKKSRTAARVSARVTSGGRNQAATRVEIYVGRDTASLILSERFRVFAGSGDDEGSVLLRFGDEGDYAVMRKADGKTMLRFPPPECVPQGFLLPGHPVKYQLGDGQMIVELPIAEWREAVNKSRET